MSPNHLKGVKADQNSILNKHKSKRRTLKVCFDMLLQIKKFHSVVLQTVKQLLFLKIIKM